MSGQKPYEYDAIVEADKALEEGKRVHRTLYQPLVDERDQCKFFIQRLEEEKSYVQSQQFSKLLTTSSIEGARNQQILDNIFDDWENAKTPERKAERAEAVRKQRDHCDTVERDFAEQVQARYNRLFEIKNQLLWLEHDHPKSVSDLEAERALLEAYYYPSEPVEPVVEPTKKSKKKKSSKKA